MYPTSHFLVPFFLAELLVGTGLLNHHHALIAGLLGVLIDLDHFIEYAIHHKDLSIKHAWNAAALHREISARTFVHHWPGFLIITGVVGGLFFVNLWVCLVIGLAYYTHIFLDYVSLNFFHIKKVESFTLEGLVLNIPLHEVILDVLLIIGIGLMLLI